MRFDNLLVAITRHKYILLLLSIFGLGISLFAVLVFVNQRIPGSDDTVFIVQTAPYSNVADWIVYRYQTWSGRFFAEGFVYIFSNAPLIFWQLISIAMYALFCGMLFAHYKLFSTKRSAAKDYIFSLVALSLPFLVNSSVLAEAGLWVTGSMVYFWMSTLGLVAFYPVAYYAVKRRLPHWLLTSASVLSAIIAASSQEQVGAVIFGLTLAVLGYSYYKSRAISWYLVLFCVVIGSSLAFSILAPGNAARIQAEVTTWLPDFYTTPLLQRIEYGYRWLLEAFINHAGYLLVIIWGSLIALFVSKKKRTRIDTCLVFVFTLAILFTLAKGSATTFWINFYASWKPEIPNIIASLNLIPWGIVLICTAIGPLVLFRKQITGYILSLLFAAAAASSAILLLSPTLYASQWRTFFVPSVLLIIMAYILLDKVIDKYWRYRYLIIGLILTLAGSHYIFQLARLLHNFHS